MPRSTSVFLALALTASVAGPAAAAAAPVPAAAHVPAGSAAARVPAASATHYRRAVSQTVEDSYYPRQGDPGVDALHYRLDLTWHRVARRLDGDTTLTFRATRSDSRGFQLNMGGPLHVDRVSLAPAGRPGRTHTVRWTHRGRELHVLSPVRRNDRYTVHVAYHGSPKPVPAPTSRLDMRGIGWHTTKHGQVWAMQEPFGAFTWYPVNDQPSDKAFYDVRIDAPRGMVGVSNGELLRRRTTRGRTVTRFTNHDPMSAYLVALAIGPYRAYHQTGPHGLPMTYWVPRDRPSLVKPLLRTPDTLRWLERRLGRYPFDRFGIVVTPSDSAMETQTMISLGRTNYSFGRHELLRTVAHEAAHAWYGDTVTPRDWRDLWMNEGMATYLETRYAVAQGWTTWRHWQRQWRRDDNLWREIYGPPGRYDRNRFAGINVYYCTALMLDRLRRKVGTEEFNRLVRRWPQSHRDSNQSRRTFVRWWDRRTGDHLDAFFQDWLSSRRTPR